nr:hypothetical protein Saspl_042209 [Ipomoea batatas]
MEVLALMPKVLQQKLLVEMTALGYVEPLENEHNLRTSQVQLRQNLTLQLCLNRTDQSVAVSLHLVYTCSKQKKQHGHHNGPDLTLKYPNKQRDSNTDKNQATETVRILTRRVRDDSAAEEEVPWFAGVEAERQSATARRSGSGGFFNDDDLSLDARLALPPN